MRNFWRTVIGKTILFLTVIIMAVVMAASIPVIYVCIDSDIYQYSEEEAIARFDDSQIEQWCHFEANNMLNGHGAEVVGNVGNMCFVMTDPEGNVVSKTEGADSCNLDHEFYFSKNTDGPAKWVEQTLKGSDDTVYIVKAGLKEGLPENDIFKHQHTLIHYASEFKFWIIAIDAAALLIAVFAFVTLMCVSGRRPKTEEIIPGPLNAIPYDVMLMAFFLVIFVPMILSQGEEEVVITFGLISIPLAIGLSMSLAARLKQKSLIKGSLTYKTLVLLWKISKKLFNAIRTVIVNIPHIWKTILLSLAVLFNIFLFAIPHRSYGVLGIFFLEAILVFPVILYAAIQRNKLMKGGKALASGDFDYKVDTKGMILDTKKHGDDLNNIAAGQKIAIAEKLKSERMKTELITNVSHDIKTPLTSIINYADLIAKDESVNENVKEYSDVLVRQSVRLKRLLEDLVEASKASTGNLEVELVPCDASIFVSQTAGEYEEKLQASGLSIITKLPDNEVKIMADGRRMQRVFDNLMNNICKYSLPGSRVYLDLKDEGSNAVFEFKNTSKEALNMSEEELVERFTRGDSSRNTEGSGLGLSIAKNLVELQGGTLRLQTDGDLFKATITMGKI